MDSVKVALAPGQQKDDGGGCTRMSKRYELVESHGANVDDWIMYIVHILNFNTNF